MLQFLASFFASPGLMVRAIAFNFLMALIMGGLIIGVVGYIRYGAIPQIVVYLATAFLPIAAYALGISHGIVLENGTKTIEQKQQEQKDASG